MRSIVPTMGLALLIGGSSLAGVYVSPSRAALGAVPARMLEQRFQRANATHDGHLTREQAALPGLRGVAEHFDLLDSAHKGYVTLGDIRSYARARRKTLTAAQE